MRRKMEKCFVQSLIGSAEIPPEAKALLPTDLLDPFYQQVYRAILETSAKGKPIDRFSLNEILKRAGDIEILYSSIDDDVSLDAVRFANLIRKDNIETALRKAVDEQDTVKARELLGQLDSINTGTKPYQSIVDYRKDFNNLDGMAIKTNFRDLDNYVKLSPEDLVVIAGRSSIGKTTLGLNILCNMTWECAVGLATLEMSGKKIFKRLAYFTSPERFNELADLFWICEPNSDFQELLKVIRQMHSQKGIRVVMVDYLQLIFARGNFKTRHQEVSYMIRQLKNLAKETGLIVIVVSTLGRSIEHREKKNARPILADLKECVTGGTEIQTDRGPRRIDKIFQRKSPYKIKTVNIETGKIEFIFPKQILHTGLKKCKRIRTKSGKWLALSEDTPLLKNGNEWVRVRDLNVGDQILVEKRNRNVRGGVRFYSGGFQFGNRHWIKGVAVRATDGAKKLNRGYMMIREQGRYQFEHRTVMENHIGRKLNKSEYIHHLDGNKTNNVITNLILCKNPNEHQRIHEKEQRFVEKLIQEGRIYFNEEKQEFILR